jgi:hypothetical protein
MEGRRGPAQYCPHRTTSLPTPEVCTGAEGFLKPPVCPQPASLFKRRAFFRKRAYGQKRLHMQPSMTPHSSILQYAAVRTY